MLRRKIELAFVSGLLAMYGVGCGSTPSGDGGGNDAAAEAAVETGPGMTYDFVINRLSIDDSDSVDTAHTGFDLDNLCSGPTDADGCNHEDFWSSFDNDQHSMGATRMAGGMGCAMGGGGCRPCVDNQLPTVINSVQAALMNMDVRMLLASQLSSGGVSILVRVSDVNDLTNDDSVTVRIYQGYPMVADCSQLFSGTAAYAVSRDSLTAGSTNLDAALVNLPGRITGGRLQVSGPMGGGSLTIPLPEIMGARIDLVLNNPQLRMNMTDTMGTRGNLGGYVAGNTLVEAVTRLAPDFRSAVEAILSGVVDVRLPGMTMCVDRTNPMMPRFGGISMGLGLTTVRAVIQPMPVAARAPGMCGTSSGGDAGPRG